jgi:hypothetical protein
MGGVATTPFGSGAFNVCSSDVNPEIGAGLFASDVGACFATGAGAGLSPPNERKSCVNPELPCAPG